MADAYASLADLKLSLQVEPSDATRDAALNRALDAASRFIDRSTGRRFWLDPVAVARTYRPAGRVMSDGSGEHLLVDDIGDVTGFIVETGTTSSWTAVTGYETGPENAIEDGRPVTELLLSSGTWGTATASRVRVTARFGWPQIPGDIEQACLLQAARLFRRKDSPEGVTGSAEWGVVRLSRRDPDVWNLLEPFMLPGFG